MALTEEQVDKVRLVLASAGWNDVMKPAYAQRAHEAVKTLVLNKEERAGQFKDLGDDQLRAIIRECEWMLSVWDNEVKVSNHNRTLDELDRVNGATANP